MPKRFREALVRYVGNRGFTFNNPALTAPICLEDGPDTEVWIPWEDFLWCHKYNPHGFLELIDERYVDERPEPKRPNFKAMTIKDITEYAKHNLQATLNVKIGKAGLVEEATKLWEKKYVKKEQDEPKPPAETFKPGESNIDQVLTKEERRALYASGGLDG